MLAEPVWWIVAALATWRLTTLFYEEKIFESVRERLGQDSLGSYPDTRMGYLLGCFKCLSVWAGVICLLILWVWPYLLLPLAFSGAAIYLREMRDSDGI